jgi:hypothetical protein
MRVPASADAITMDDVILSRRALSAWQVVVVAMVEEEEEEEEDEVVVAVVVSE